MESSAYPKPTKKVCKRRIELEKRVVKVKIEGNTDQTVKSQFLPSDSCSWRKYGQKPIKGTPYPRGYYKCTTSQGCLAKKQVDRSKDDASMVIITYTSDHNHPSPDNQAHQKQQPKSPGQAQQPPVLPEQEEPYVLTMKNKCIQGETEEENDVPWSEMMVSLSTQGPNSGGENGFFHELGELPQTTAYSSFTSFMKNHFFDEQMLVLHP